MEHLVSKHEALGPIPSMAERDRHREKQRQTDRQTDRDTQRKKLVLMRRGPTKAKVPRG